MHDRDLRLAAILRRIGGNRHHDGFLLPFWDGDHSAVATVEYGGFAAKFILVKADHLILRIGRDKCGSHRRPGG